MKVFHSLARILYAKRQPKPPQDSLVPWLKDEQRAPLESKSTPEVMETTLAQKKQEREERAVAGWLGCLPCVGLTAFPAPTANAPRLPHGPGALCSISTSKLPRFYELNREHGAWRPEKGAPLLPCSSLGCGALLTGQRLVLHAGSRSRDV